MTDSTVSSPLPPDGSPAADSSEWKGEPFGRYLLVSEVGRGAMGIVWKAWDTRLKRIVALKQILAEEWVSPESCERFVREAQLAGQLHHPNIVGVLDAGEEEGRHYLTMEFLDGVPLSRAFQGRATARQAMEWTRQVADALGYAHAQGVIHRDVKPANILVDRTGKAFVVDFGLARVADAEATAARTASGAVLGTPLYMSPEQASGDRSLVGPPADQFSLGVVLYELLAGRPPFEGGALRDLLNAISEKDPVPPRRIDPSIPIDAETICLRALEKSPGKRYGSMSELAGDLARALAGEPILARPLSSSEILIRQARRHRAALAASVLVFAVVAVFLAWRWRDRSRAEDRVLVLLREAEAIDRDASRLVGRAAEARYREASARFGEVLAVDPARSEATAGRDRAEHVVRALAEGRAAAERLLEEARPRLERAAHLFYDPEATYEDVLKQVEPARATIEEALRRAPDLATGEYLAGRALAIEGLDREAFQRFDRALAIDSRFAPALFERARLEFGWAYVDNQPVRGAGTAANASGGVEYCRAAVADLRSLQDSTVAGPAADPPEEWRIAMEFACAMGLYLAGDLAGAEKACRKALDEFPRSEGREVFHWTLGILLQGEAAESELDRAISVCPHLPLARYCRGVLRMERGDPKGAEDDLSAAVEFNPELSLAWAQRGVVREALGRHEEAVADLDEALRIDPELYLARHGDGLAPLQKGDREGALAALRIEVGILRVMQGDLDGAQREFEAVPETDPLGPLARYDIGCVRALRSARDPSRAAEERDLAFQDLSRAIDLGFSDVDLLTSDADLESLRRDPRWKPLLDRLVK